MACRCGWRLCASLHPDCSRTRANLDPLPPDTHQQDWEAAVAAGAAAVGVLQRVFGQLESSSSSSRDGGGGGARQ